MKEIITVRIEKADKAAMIEIAKDDNRTLSSLIQFIIADYVYEYNKLHGGKDD